jgi:hypothetical protein
MNDLYVSPPRPKLSVGDRAKSIKKFYDALRDEGFSKEDAMEILKAYLKSGRS